MKKIRKISITAIAMLLVVMLGSALFAANTGSYSVGVTIVENQGVAIVIPTSWTVLGYVVQGTSITTKTIGSVTVRNVGQVNIDLQARISGSPTGWTPGTSLGDTGPNKYVLAMVFHTWDGLLLSANAYSCFGDEDVLTTSDKTSTTTTFASSFIPGESVATPATNDGVDVEPYRQLNSHFFFNAPTSLSEYSQYGQQQTITVTLTAVQHQ
jgi:hypothetical protein